MLRPCSRLYPHCGSNWHSIPPWWNMKWSKSKLRFPIASPWNNVKSGRFIYPVLWRFTTPDFNPRYGLRVDLQFLLGHLGFVVCGLNLTALQGAKEQINQPCDGISLQMMGRHGDITGDLAHKADNSEDFMGIPPGYFMGYVEPRIWFGSVWKFMGKMELWRFIKHGMEWVA